MLRDVDAVGVGDTVYLYPNTKFADRDCHARRTCTVVTNPKAYWPKVLVQWDHPTEGRVVQRLIHKDNIRLTPASKAETGNDGDSTTDHAEPVFAQPRILGSAPAPLDEAYGEQETLF